MKKCQLYKYLFLRYGVHILTSMYEGVAETYLEGADL